MLKNSQARVVTVNKQNTDSILEDKWFNAYVQNVLTDIFYSTHSYNKTQEITPEIERILGEAYSSRDCIFKNLSCIRSYDLVTYEHSVNTAIIAVSLGLGLGLPENKLVTLCKASLMHDIGKVFIPLEILNKNGKLTKEEFLLIQKHSQFSYDFLRAYTPLGKEVLNIVLNHHEKLNGSGYPNNKRGSELDTCSRILTVADVFDALVQKRPYHGKRTPEEAIRIMLDESYKYDKDVLNCLTELLSSYRVGMMVKLSNGLKGCVVKVWESNYTKPVVKDISTGTVYDLAKEEFKNISVDKIYGGKTT